MKAVTSVHTWEKSHIVVTEKDLDTVAYGG